MNIFYSLNIIFLISNYLLVYEYIRRKWHLPKFNPVFILLILYIPTKLAPLFLGPIFILDNGLFNYYYQYAILMENISLLGTFIITISFFSLLKKNPNFEFFITKLYSYPFSRTKLIYVEFVFFLLAIIVFILMAESDMGLINWLLSPREGYQYHRSGVGSLYAASLTFLSLAYTLSFLSSKNNISFIIKSVFYISLVFFWGSKGFILSFFSFLILCLWVVKYKYLNLVLLVFTPIVSLILLVNLALALGNVNFVNFVEYFDHYKNSAMFYESYLNGEFKLFHGKVFLSDFWSVVPRGLYEAKPYVYGISHVNELFFPGMAEKGHTPAFGGPVMEFSDFGVFSVFLFSLLNFSYLFKLYLFNYYFKMRGVVSFSKNSILILIFCICFSPMFLAYIPISLSIIFVFFIWLLIAFFARLRFKS